MKRVSQSHFKPRAFECLREVDERGEPIEITDDGRPTVAVVTEGSRFGSAAGSLEGTIRSYVAPETPVEVFSLPTTTPILPNG